jgi:hypothetical protein
MHTSYKRVQGYESTYNYFRSPACDELSLSYPEKEDDMNPRARVLIVVFVFSIGVSLFATQAYASEPVAKIASFQGEVIVQSDKEITRVTRIGQTLKDGDRVQTKDGQVQITFSDGAVMKVRPYTSTLIQEREEWSGWAIFKAKKAVRRITCYIGKLWFKTGASKRKNYLQTPTAVCGLRGSDGDCGFDGTQSLLNMYSGLADIIGGSFVRGAFTDPGVGAANRSTAYQSLERAKEQIDRAQATGDPVDQARAEAAAVAAIIESAEVLKVNPVPAVAEEAAKVAEEARKAQAEINKQLQQMGVEPEATTTGTTAETTSATTAPTSSTSSSSSTTTTIETTEETTVSP